MMITGYWGKFTTIQMIRDLTLLKEQEWDPQ